mmetsp:Transcript_141667/g.260558  ORF Transcript_141667/g.260558 Transcript_141667/m.260558 type:complete len:206 (+) Transcript_141667:517-1134(+)
MRRSLSCPPSSSTTSVLSSNLNDSPRYTLIIVSSFCVFPEYLGFRQEEDIITRRFSPAALIIFTKRWTKMSQTSRSFLEKKSPYVEELPSHVCMRITERSISAASLLVLPENNFLAIEKFASLNESGELPGSRIPTLRTPSMSRKIHVSTDRSGCTVNSSSSRLMSSGGTGFILLCAFGDMQTSPSGWRKLSASSTCDRLKPVPT